jgi:hypothetical protein
MSPRYTPVFSALGLSCLSLVATSCVNESDGPSDPGHGAARFEQLLYNPKWYRTFDSSHTISIPEGTLTFSWTYEDSLEHSDSFYVAIDSLWLLPQNVNGDTSRSGDWDVQFCPNGEFCLGGLVDGVQGANAPYPFPVPLALSQVSGKPFGTEHHFNFFPASHPTLGYGLSPDSAIVGAMMIVSSRSGSSPADTVFAFGSWKLAWDDTYPPPVRPVNGYLPKRSDFEIVNGMVRYTGP